MKRTFFSLVQASACVLLLITGCQKPSLFPLSTTDDQQLIATARQYFERMVTTQPSSTPTGNPRLDLPRSPYWPAAYTAHYGSDVAVVVPVFYQKHMVLNSSFNNAHLLSLNQLTKLVITKDASGFHTQVITLFPDSSWRNPAADPFAGYAFVESWQGQPITRYRFMQNLILKQSTTSNASGLGNKIAASDPKQSDALLANCGTISGYNYSAIDPSDTYSWSEPAGCDYSYLADPEGPGYLPPTQIPKLARPTIPLATIVIEPPTNIIGNISDYFKCFTNGSSPDQTYSVQVCVDQPSPGTRQPWTLTSGGAAGTSSSGNPLNVGHSFLVLTENNQGNITTRNVGFYPASSIFPVSGYTSAQGVLNDDDGHPYNISLTINVSATQFFGVLNYVSLGNNPGFNYDLYTDNCTTFVINALGNNGIPLPNTKGTWATGSGNDPGDLGQDINQMQLGPNMTRNTVSNPHPNIGTCN